MGLFPATATKVEKNTDHTVNERIINRMNERISQCQSAGVDGISHSLQELDEEWDTERVLETSAASFILLGLALGYFIDSSWYWFSGIVAAFLLLHALQGWCPPLPIIRRMGIRSAAEINRERTELIRLEERFTEYPTQDQPSTTWYH